MLSKLQALLKRTKEWKDIEYFHNDWKERVKFMSQFITSGSSVMDLGCGKMWLKEYLRQEITYIPVDYCKRSADTIVADFNKKQFPSVYVDNIFISGCLEYLKYPNWLIEKACRHTEKIIISYCCTEEFPEIDERRKKHWNSHLSANDIELSFSQQGFTLYSMERLNGKDRIMIFIKA